MNYFSQMGPWVRHYDGRHPGMFFVGCLLVGAVVVLAVLLYRSHHPAAAAPAVANPSAVNSATANPAANAEIILAERLARGEVSIDDFTAARAALRGESGTTSP